MRWYSAGRFFHDLANINYSKISNNYTDNLTYNTAIYKKQTLAKNSNYCTLLYYALYSILKEKNSLRLIFAVPDQSSKNAKIMRLENFGLNGNSLASVPANQHR